MSNGNAERKITQLVAPCVSNHDLFLEMVVLTHANPPLLRITVDLPSGTDSIDSQAVDAVARDISKVLDDADPIAGRYTLEVTSPGAERKLTTARHFERVVGQPVEITTVDKQRLRGRLIAADETRIVLTPLKLRRKEQAEGSDVNTVVELDNIAKARSRVEFGSQGE